jgi:hypothetical protein
MPGYIYLIMMADGVYKVGRTQQDYGNYLKRLKSYPPDSQIVYVRKVQGDVLAIETEIIEMFRNEFGKHIRGNEFYLGDENRMIEIIHQVTRTDPVARFKNHALKRFIESDKIIVDPSRSCPLNVMALHFREWCRRNEIGLFKFNENFYKDVFSYYNVQVIQDARSWRENFYSNQPFVLGMDLKTDIEMAIDKLTIDRPTHIETVILSIEARILDGLYVSKSEVVSELEKRGYVIAPISGIVHPPPEPLK